MLLNGFATVEVSRWHRDSRTVKIVNIYNNDPVRITPKRIYWRDKMFCRETGKCLSAFVVGGRYTFRVMTHRLKADTRPKIEPGSMFI